jgi:hypothetical protein
MTALIDGKLAFPSSEIEYGRIDGVEMVGKL